MIRTLYGTAVALISFVYLAYLLQVEGVTPAQAIRDALIVTLPIIIALLAFWSHRSRDLTRSVEAVVVVVGILSAVIAVALVFVAPF